MIICVCPSKVILLFIFLILPQKQFLDHVVLELKRLRRQKQYQLVQCGCKFIWQKLLYWFSWCLWDTYQSSRSSEMTFYCSIVFHLFLRLLLIFDFDVLIVELKYLKWKRICLFNGNFVTKLWNSSTNFLCMCKII